MSSFIKPFYDIDRLLLEKLDILYKETIEIFEGRGLTEKEFNSIRKEFISLFSQYDWAYWRYIQKQADGKDMNSGEAFDECYKQFIEELKDEKSDGYTIIE